MSSRITGACAVAAAVFASIVPATAGAAVAANSGLPGSRCVPVGVDAAAPANAGSLDTTSLGPKASAPYTIGAATSPAERGQPVERVMMMLHGGGWYTVGQGALNVTQGDADVWRDAGWEAVNVDYLGCGRSIRSALKMYDLVRAHYDAAIPVCISGDSAGAQLALIVASRRSSVACVVANGPPTDLPKLARQGVHAVAAGLAPALLSTGAVAASGVARAAFGRAGMRAASPITRAATISTRVLLATAQDDLMIPVAQVSSMARALRRSDPDRYVDTVVVAPGEYRFVHGTASTDAFNDYYAHVAALVQPFGLAPTLALAKPDPAPSKKKPNLIDSLLGWLFRAG